VAEKNGIEGAADIEGRFGPPGLELQRVAIPVEKAEASPCVLLRGGGKDAPRAYDSAGATIKRGKPTGRAANYCLAAVVEAARVGLGTSASCFDPQALTGTLSFGRGSRSATCLGPVSRGLPALSPS